MPRISSYPQDTQVSGNDIWIGSDGDNGLITKNFSPDSLAQYYISTGALGFGTYEFPQPIPQTTWVINHGLAKFPSVTVVDTSGNVIVGFQTYNTSNQITLTFSAPFSGTAYLN